MIFKVILSIAFFVAIANGYRGNRQRNNDPELTRNGLFPDRLFECPNRIFEAKHLCNNDPDSPDGARMCAGHAEEYRDSSNTQPAGTTTVIFYQYNDWTPGPDYVCRSNIPLRRFTCRRTTDNFWGFNCNEEARTYAPHDIRGRGHLHINEL